ncbi:MAG: PhzF family phenazine biosynthesis protein [Burkholderiales bacterium]
MTRLRFHTLDVFTETLFGGNPLAVVLDADALSGAQMQRIAAEFNLSETVFVLKPAKAGAKRRRLRIFTPQAELPFAGHPTVGTSYLLAALKYVEVSQMDPVMVLEEGVGDVAVTVNFSKDVPVSTRMSVPRMPERGPEPPPRKSLAAMLSLADDDLLPAPAAWSCGVPFLFLPVRDRVALARVRLRMDLWEELLSGWWARSVFPFTPDTISDDTRIHARAFAPALGIPEDPATGGAVSALAGFLHDRAPDSSCRRWLIEQGFDMGRPSHIELESDFADGRITGVRVGGTSVLVAEGWINVD